MMDRSPSFWMKILLHKKNGTAGNCLPVFTVLLHKIFRILLSKNLENVFIKYRNRKKKKNITKKRKILLLETGKNKYIFWIFMKRSLSSF